LSWGCNSFLPGSLNRVSSNFFSFVIINKSLSLFRSRICFVIKAGHDFLYWSYLPIRNITDMVDHKRRSSVLLKISVVLSTTTEYLIQNIKSFKPSHLSHCKWFACFNKERIKTANFIWNMIQVLPVIMRYANSRRTRGWKKTDTQCKAFHILIDARISLFYPMHSKTTPWRAIYFSTPYPF